MKLKKVIASLTLLTVVLFGSSAAFAETASSGYPSVTYGSTSEYSAGTYYGPWQLNKWSFYAYAYRYNSWDKDSFEAINAKANVSLSSSSTSTYSFSGSTEFGIKKIAQVNLNGTFGETWGKTSTVSFDAAPGYIYELWSANRQRVEKYQYPRFGASTLYSKAYDKDGTYKWFFRHAR